MNQIFRVIWNHATQSWVAVSELTKAYKKQSRNSLKAVLGGALVLCSINTAEAGVAIGSTSDNTLDKGTALASDSGIAIGKNSNASKENNNIAIGDDTNANGAYNIVIGKNAVAGSDGRGNEKRVGQSVAIGGGNKEWEGAKAFGDQSIALGANTLAYGNSSIAIGNDDVDRAVVATTTYTNSEGNKVTGTIGAAYTNLTGKNLHTDGGRYKDTKSGEAAVAIGVKAQAGDISVSLGTGATAEKVNAVALGSGANATFDNSVALGGGSTTDKEGTKQTSVTVNGHTYNWSGGSTTGKGDVVSIGKAGFERQLKNVAAGEVSETSTDGINGSQLYGILSNMTLDPTFLYAGDDADKGEVTGADADAKKADAATKKIVSRSMKDGRLNLLGGATGELSDNNIAVKYGNDNTLNVKLAKDLKGLNSTDVGGIVTNADGINMNNKPITNLAAGTNPTDAVNKSQLDKVATNNIKLGGDSGTTDAQQLDKTGGLQFNVKGTNGLTTTASGTDVTVKLDDTTKDKIDNAADKDLSNITPAAETKIKNLVTWKAKANNSGINLDDDTVDTDDTAETIGADGILTLDAGKNLRLQRKGKVFTYGLDSDLTGINSITGLASTLPVTKNDAAAPTTNQAAPTDVDGTKAASVNDILNAGWNLQNNGEAKDFVKPYDTVNFIDGEGTKAVVDTKDNKVSTVKFDVKLGTGLKKDDQGNITVDAGNITNENGVPKVADADKVATAGNVANAINNSYWTASAKKGNDKIGTDDNVKPGTTVTFDAGKNIEIDHSTANKFTFKTVDNPEFTGVDLKDKDGNKVNLAPTADGLKLGKGDNNEPANITNVTSGLKPYAETAPDSPDAKKGLVDLSKPKDGSEPAVSDNTSATVGDLRNMGWVVSADKTTGDLGNPYSEAVKNANEVKFVGTGSATVSGKTDDKGVRTITVDVNDQAVANNAEAPVVYTDENGDRVYPTGKKDEKGNLIFSKNPDGSGDPVTGPVKTSINGPEGTKSPTTLDNVAGNLPGAKKDTEAPTTTGVGPTEEEAKKIANNAATVGDVLNAGWNLQGNGKDVDFVKPYDTVNFVDGEGTTAIVETADNKVSTVKYNVNLGAGLEKGPDNKINIKTDGDTITVGDDGGLKVNTGSITVNDKDGKDADGNDVKAGTVSVPKADQNKVATVGDVANAINNAAWKATSGKDGSGVVTGTTTPLVKAGNTVTYRAGNNLMLDQADKTFTYSLNPTLTGLTSAEFKDKDGNVNKIDANGMTITPADKDKQPVSLTNNGLDNGNNRITNVAPGVKDTDAVNVSQLRNAVGNLNKLQGQINKLGNRMNAGMATSAAMANLLQPHKPGQSVATAGIGQHKNQSAVAVGYSRISDNGKYGVRFSMGANTQGEVTGGAAVGYFW